MRAYLTQLLAAQQMAMTHIEFDLQDALKKHGTGNDANWSCVGGVVSECQKK